MRKLFVLLVFAFVALAASAQVGAVKSVTIDTLDNTNARTSDVVTVSSSYNAITFQAKCTQLGGTSDGTLVLYGSVDGISYLPVIIDNVFVKAYPNDTLTITSGAIWQVTVKDAIYKYYKVIGTGTSGDTTLVSLKYLLK